MAVVAALEAVRDTGLTPTPSTGAVIGTGLGALADTVSFIEQILQGDPAQANPGLFPATVMNVAASQISMELGLTGFNTTINHKEISGELVLLLAFDVLRLGRADGLLCGGVDELTRPVFHGYRRFGALASGRPRPYRSGRAGMVLGEGAAVLLLEPLEVARERGAEVLAEVAGASAMGGERPLVGWGPAGEQGRVVGPALEAGVAAVEGALAEAGLSAGDVDLVIGSGNGSRDLDRLEAEVLARVFEGRAVPLTSPHGALGSWMAAGALRLALGVEVLRSGRVFPTATRGDPDPQVVVPGLHTAGREPPPRPSVVLVCGHATGGGSSAVVLVRETG
jgi:3-oxoacyl-(acyl-carrier-protein) synthase